MSGGGKGGGGVSLKSRDVNQILNTQQGLSNESAYRQAALNNMNQQTPFGTISYSPTPGTGRYAGFPTRYDVKTTLSPEQQRIYGATAATQGIGAETAQRLATNMWPTLSSPVDLSSLGAVPGLDMQGRDALTDAIMKRMAPDIEADRARSETRLANQGITAGSEAFNDAQRRLEQAINDQRTSAYIGGAGAEQERQLQARQQAISEKLLPRQQGLSELQALLGASPIQMPTAQGTSQTAINPADAASAYGILQGALQGQAGQQNNLMNNLFGLGGSLGGATLLRYSDRRLKSDIVYLCDITTGKGMLPLYAYTINGDREIGFMADEVEGIDPDAVHTIGGYKVVDYGRIMS